MSFLLHVFQLVVTMIRKCTNSDGGHEHHTYTQKQYMCYVLGSPPPPPQATQFLIST